MNIDQWYCVTAVYNANTVKMYIDGVLASTYACKPGVMGVNTDGIYVGINVAGGAGKEYSFKGIIDDIKLYNGVLSVNEVICSDKVGGEDTTTSVFQVQNLSQFPQLRLHPNPATEYIYCHTSGQQGAYTICDHTGRLYASGTLQKDITQVNISSLPAGIYTIQYTTAGGRATSKFVKQ
jgi:hypothetical protein